MVASRPAAVQEQRSAAMSVPPQPAARRTVLPQASTVGPITVAVLAGDPITGQGAAVYLDSCPHVKVLPASRQHEAEVILILVSWITDETLAWMQQVADAAQRDVRFVLVGDGIREHQLLRAISCGLVSVIPRQEADFDRILRVIAATREGSLEMPGVALGWVMNQIRGIQQDVLEPKGLTTAGLEARETDVLGLLAEGLGTAEIAERLHYSERTVKNIIHGVLTRCRLRNRAHAVAFALRNGAI
ncbi:MAG TPA: response regulator transcription factor [Actinocrinis sp.]|jgi:DNA-binding NarL/FixJ family response regulator|uniref:response regulator transcription factor n=1 Tax=Actinocrinis sp. TaxID=1920516 RepID=UPI002DDCCCA9|nr:response regulator transcription factor [Actinocrinis sp.]HEV3169574.1 response regulator transcription factor [Actinocrinis sp.]